MTSKKLHINEEDFTRYLENKMTDTERNAFEKELQKYSFETEALEGLNTISSHNIQDDLNEIKAKIEPRKRQNSLRYWAAAASILLVVSAGIIWIQVKDQNMVSEIAETKSVEKEEIIQENSDRISEPLQLKKEINETTYSEVIHEIEDKQKTAEIAETTVIESEPPQKSAAKKSVKIRGVSQPAATDESLMITGNVLDTEKSENTTEKYSFKQQKKKANNNNNNNEQIENYQVLEDAPISSVVGTPVAAPRLPKEIVDSKAHPFGGFEDYKTYLDSIAILPKNYDKKKAVVKIEFKIDSQGVISDFRNKNDADTLLFSKAKEILLNGPKWSPEIKNGKRLNSSVKLKIIFRKID